MFDECPHFSRNHALASTKLGTDDAFPCFSFTQHRRRSKALSLFVVDMQDAKHQRTITTKVKFWPQMPEIRQHLNCKPELGSTVLTIGKDGSNIHGGHMEITPVRTMMNHSTTQVRIFTFIGISVRIVPPATFQIRLIDASSGTIRFFSTT